MDNPFCAAATSMRSRADSFRNPETPRAPDYRVNSDRKTATVTLN